MSNNTAENIPEAPPATYANPIQPPKNACNNDIRGNMKQLLEFQKIKKSKLGMTAVVTFSRPSIELMSWSIETLLV